MTGQGSGNTATIYVGQHFEVRDHEAPTKYVFTGSTRVARVTGSFSSNQRVQRLRVFTGWNLCSLSVTATNFLNAAQPEVSAYRWDPAVSSWLTVQPSETLPAGTVMWLHAVSNATVQVTGMYSDPTNRTVNVNGDYVPSAGLEVWDIQWAISNLCCISAWLFDAQAARWFSWLPPLLRQPSDLSPVVGPGEAIFARSDTLTQFDVPNSALRIRFYHQDHLGSSSCLTDAQGNLAEETANYPFGFPRCQFRPKGIREPYQFTQKELDAESYFQYFEARYYVGTIGTFLSPDRHILEVASETVPAKEHTKTYEMALRTAQTWNIMGYALRNPVKFTDTGGQEVQLVETMTRNAPERLKLSDADRKLFNNALKAMSDTSEGRKILESLKRFNVQVSKGDLPTDAKGMELGRTLEASVHKGSPEVMLDFNKLKTLSKDLKTDTQTVKFAATVLYHELRHVEAYLADDFVLNLRLDMYHFPSEDTKERKFMEELRPPLGPDWHGGIKVHPDIPWFD